MPEGEDLYFISDDKDYYSEFSKDQFNIYLLKEWKDTKKSDIHFYRSLHEFLNENYKKYSMTSEQQKENLISDLYKSCSFIETHSIISKLMTYSDWSQKNIIDLCTAAVQNSQVNWIIRDEDVYKFYKDLLQNFKDQDESVANVNNMLNE